MKILLLLLCLCFFCRMQAQYYETVKSTHTVVEQHTSVLNGTLNAAAGGVSKKYIPFDLPPNTTEWFYSFTTAKGSSGIKNLNLAVQLYSYTQDMTGTAAKVLKNIEIPTGASNINIYLLDYNNMKAFMNDDRFSYQIEGSTKKTREGIFRIDDVTKGRWFLGISNPSTLEGVNVSIEVTAIVKNEVYVDQWTVENTSNLKSACLEGFNTTKSGQTEVCECLTEKITTKNTPSVWNKKSASSKERITSSEIDVCYTQTGNIALKNAEKEYIKQKNYNQNITIAQNHVTSQSYEKAIVAYEEALEIYPNEEIPKEKIIELKKAIKERDYNKAVSTAQSLESIKKYEKAIKSYEKALTIYPDKNTLKEKIVGLKKAIIERDYNDALRYGEINIGLENLEIALQQFQNAAKLKPSEIYPKEKIKEIKILIEKQRIERARVDKCVTRLNNEISDANTSAMISDYKDAQLKISKAIDSIVNDNNVQKRYSSEQMSEIYNNAFWWSTLNNDIKSAGTYIKKAINSKSSGMNFDMNLALYHLLTGNYDKALKEFEKYKKREKMNDGIKWIDAIAERLNTLESNGINYDFARLKSDLKIK